MEVDEQPERHHVRRPVQPARDPAGVDVLAVVDVLGRRTDARLPAGSGGDGRVLLQRRITRARRRARARPGPAGGGPSPRVWHPPRVTCRAAGRVVAGARRGSGRPRSARRRRHHTARSTPAPRGTTPSTSTKWMPWLPLTSIITGPSHRWFPAAKPTIAIVPSASAVTAASTAPLARAAGRARRTDLAGRNGADRGRGGGGHHASVWPAGGGRTAGRHPT